MQQASITRSWANVVQCSLTSEERAELKLQNSKQQLLDEHREFYAKRQAKAISDYDNLPNVIHTYGDFWFYKVEDTINDSHMAHLARHGQHDAFINYLRDKYGRKWLTLSKDTDDDCAFLREWRILFKNNN